MNVHMYIHRVSYRICMHYVYMYVDVCILGGETCCALYETFLRTCTLLFCTYGISVTSLHVASTVLEERFG